MNHNIGVRAKNLMILTKTGKQNKSTFPKTNSFYLTGRVLLSKGKEYQIYSRGKADYHVDIPIGSNDLGTIHNGYFCYLGFKAHPYTLDATHGLQRVQDHINAKDLDLAEMAIGLITKFREQQ